MREPPPKSRSQLRREEDERQEIASRFVSLGPNQIDQLPLDEEVRRAIGSAATDLTHVPKRRAKLRVAGLLRDIPLEELREIVARIERGETIRSSGRERLIDRWVDSLLSNEAAAIDELLEVVPGVDVSRLRQLLRNARKEQTEASDAPASGRALREYLTELTPSFEVRPGPVSDAPAEESR